MRKERGILEKKFTLEPWMFFIALLVFMLGVLAGLAMSHHDQAQREGVKNMQLKELIIDCLDYDYSICGDCRHRPMCEEYQVICGAWHLKVRAARHACFLRAMRGVSDPGTHLLCT